MSCLAHLLSAALANLRVRDSLQAENQNLSEELGKGAFVGQSPAAVELMHKLSTPYGEGGRSGFIEFEGNLSGVHWIGAHLRSGEVHVHGAAGRHIGSEMRGGEIRAGRIEP